MLHDFSVIVVHPESVRWKTHSLSDSLAQMAAFLQLNIIVGTWMKEHQVASVVLE